LLQKSQISRLANTFKTNASTYFIGPYLVVQVARKLRLISKVLSPAKMNDFTALPLSILSTRWRVRRRRKKKRRSNRRSLTAC